jgi:hypothetical protein
MQTVVCMDVHYYSPDGKVGDWYSRADFISPVTNASEGDDAVDGRPVELVLLTISLILLICQFILPLP